MRLKPGPVRAALACAIAGTLWPAATVAQVTVAAVQLGDRPAQLVAGMDDGPLKRQLSQCTKGPFHRTNFSIGHRGAPAQYAEHTRESYEAAARQGAGIVECDVTFTRDGVFVCRHAHNDLHDTTNILETALASRCRKPFTPAVFDARGTLGAPASAECRAPDLTLAEFRQLEGRMPRVNPAARTVAEYLPDTPRGELMTFRESIALNSELGVGHTPELKGADAETLAVVFGNQRAYALKFAAELRAAGVSPADVWPQSFNPEDVFVWIDATEYGGQAVLLMESVPPDRAKFLQSAKQRGVRIVAPPMPALLTVDDAARVIPSSLAGELRALDFKIITWTFERSDLRRGAANAGFYYRFDPQGRAVRAESDMYTVLDVLAHEVGIAGIFSDWPATVTLYANCLGLDQGRDRAERSPAR